MLLNINLNLNNMNMALNNNTIDKEFDAFMVNFISSEESIVSQQSSNENVITAFVKKYQKSLNQVFAEGLSIIGKKENSNVFNPEVVFANVFKNEGELVSEVNTIKANLTELKRQIKEIKYTHTEIKPSLVAFTPVTHALYEKKTIFSPFKHPFHIIDPSPWPFCVAMALWYLALTGVSMVHGYIAKCPVSFTLLGGFLYLVLSVSGWWRDVIRESTYEFKHTPYVRRGLLLGMMLFILSEVMFFAGFFWGFFHSSLVPSPAIGGVWPPATIMVISPWNLPLVNTLLLLLSGVTLTISHRSLFFLPYYNKTDEEIERAVSLIMLWLKRTIFLGIFFLFCQAFEYYFAPFTFQDTVYGGTFYILTGLHGMHVLVGTIFLIVCLWRVSLYHFTLWKQVGFKSAVWYWHFVDVVWIFLYLVIYIWGNA